MKLTFHRETSERHPPASTGPRSGPEGAKKGVKRSLRSISWTGGSTQSSIQLSTHRWIKCGGVVGDGGGVAEEDGDDVEVDFFAGRVCGDVAAGSAHYPAAFGGRHVEGRVEAVALVEALDLYDADGVAVIHYEVEFIVSAAPVALQKGHAHFLQIA